MKKISHMTVQPETEPGAGDQGCGQRQDLDERPINVGNIACFSGWRPDSSLASSGPVALQDYILSEIVKYNGALHAELSTFSLQNRSIFAESVSRVPR